MEQSTQAARKARTRAQDAPREGVRCPVCGNGRWQLGATPAGMPRAWCRKPKGCGKTWAPWPDWKRGPGFGITPPEKIATIERLLAAGHGLDDVRLLAAGAGVSTWTARKYRARWLARSITRAG